MAARGKSQAGSVAYSALKKIIPSFLRRNEHLRAAIKILYASYFYRFANLGECRIPGHSGKKTRLLLDMSVIAGMDHKTGIQRVAKNIFSALERQAPDGLELVPVYASARRRGYFMAQVSHGSDGPHFIMTSEEAAANPGDIFLALDFAPLVIISQLACLRTMRARGVRLFFMVYDLIPVTHGSCFPAGTRQVHISWLRRIGALGEMICNSQAVCGQLADWFSREKIPVASGGIHCMPNGYDSDNFLPRNGQDAARVPQRPYMLLVSTVEPRKGHEQAVAAFETLWSAGSGLALVLVGKKGWKMDAFCQNLKKHPELGRRLFWFDDCEDGLLGTLYDHADCVLMPSLAEGFGLSLIEGAARGCPLLIRDIPVFREIAGVHASYFSGLTPRDLAKAIDRWQEMRKQGHLPDSSKIRIWSWDESAVRLLEAVGLACGKTRAPGESPGQSL